jgi:hypothetical protein
MITIPFQILFISVISVSSVAKIFENKKSREKNFPRLKIERPWAALGLPTASFS